MMIEEFVDLPPAAATRQSKSKLRSMVNLCSQGLTFLTCTAVYAIARGVTFFILSILATQLRVRLSPRPRRLAGTLAMGWVSCSTSTELGDVNTNLKAYERIAAAQRRCLCIDDVP